MVYRNWYYGLSSPVLVPGHPDPALTLWNTCGCLVNVVSARRKCLIFLNTQRLVMDIMSNWGVLLGEGAGVGGTPKGWATPTLVRTYPAIFRGFPHLST